MGCQELHQRAAEQPPVPVLLLQVRVREVDRYGLHLTCEGQLSQGKPWGGGEGPPSLASVGGPSRPGHDPPAAEATWPGRCWRCPTKKRGGCSRSTREAETWSLKFSGKADARIPRLGEGNVAQALLLGPSGGKGHGVGSELQADNPQIRPCSRHPAHEATHVAADIQQVPCRGLRGLVGEGEVNKVWWQPQASKVGYQGRLPRALKAPLRSMAMRACPGNALATSWLRSCRACSCNGFTGCRLRGRVERLERLSEFGGWSASHVIDVTSTSTISDTSQRLLRSSEGKEQGKEHSHKLMLRLPQGGIHELQAIQGVAHLLKQQANEE